MNVADDYRLEAELVNTNDELVAMTFSTNYCATGTNVFELTFTSDAIHQNGRSGIHAVKNVQLWCGDEMIDANAVALELKESRDIADFVPSGISVVVDSSSGRFLKPTATPDGKLSSVQFVFDVTNATDTMVGYDVAAVLMNTNSEIVASIRTAVAVTNGLNQIEITIPASAIAASGEDGPYRFDSIELLPQGESTCGTTYRPNVLSGSYTASDFGGAAVKSYGAPRFVETSDWDNLTFEYSYEVFRTGMVIAEIVLADKDGNLAACVATTNEVVETGVKTNVISIAHHDLVENDAGAPYAVASLSLRPDISGEEPIYVDTASLTNILWLVAPPVFSPTTRTVFFGSRQPVVISCETASAEIHYTLDGTEPTESSPIYDGSLFIEDSAVLRARAFVEYMRPSETVHAEYVRAAIVGDNLVQNDTLTTGETQILRLPASGTYKASFDYSQGGDVELRMVGNGTTNTLAVISTGSAGSTNFLFEVTDAGRYELSVFDPSLGTVQPATLSGLKVCIPNTERNKSRYWIYETEDTFGSTGEWVAEFGFVNGTMLVEDTSVFTASQRSSGRNVTILTTIEGMDAICPDEYGCENIENAKGAVRIVLHEDATRTFQALSTENGQKIWLDVSGVGLDEPDPESPYTFKLTIDYTNCTYEVALVEHGGRETPLTHGTTNSFSFVGNTNSAVISQIEYRGYFNILSLQGSDDCPEDTFMQGDTLPFDVGYIPAITEGQAAWLNSMNSYDVVKVKVSSMNLNDLEEAYLLNLDITQDVFGLEMFKVLGVEVTETEVRIHVWLNRIGAIQVDNDGRKQNAPINGTLRLYGGTTPQAMNLLNATMVTDASFATDDTVTISYPRSEDAKFFRPVIETPLD